MLLFARQLVIAACLLAAGLATAQRAEASKPELAVALEKLSLASCDSEKLELQAMLSFQSARRAALKEVSFEGLRLNGLPFYASRIASPLQLLPGQRVLLDKPLVLTVYLRDLDNLKPVRELVSEGQLLVTGMAYADLQLSPAAKALLLTTRARVPVEIRQRVNLELPGGAMSRQAALTLIDGLQSGLNSAGELWQAVSTRFSSWRRQLWAEYAPRLVLVYARYKLRDSAGNSYDFDGSYVGFRTAGRQIVVPQVALEPWRFDPLVLGSTKQDPGLKVTDYDLWVWPANAQVRDNSNALMAAGAWRLSARQLRLSPAAKGKSEPLLVPTSGVTPIKVKVPRRQGAAALGVIEIVDPAASSVQPLPMSVHLESTDATLALFRFPAGTNARSARPDLLITSGSTDGPKLKVKVDSSALGSPVIAPGGVVGVVTGEESVVPIGEVIKALNLQSQGSNPEAQ